MAEIGQILNTATEGMARSRERIEKTAGRLARMPDAPGHPGDEVNLSQEMINLLYAKRNYEANLKVIETANKMETNLIDLLG